MDESRDVGRRSEGVHASMGSVTQRGTHIDESRNIQRRSEGEHTYLCN